MLAGALSAQAAFVPSDNIYGIINIPIVPGMNAIGVSLLPISGSTVNDVVLPDGLVSGEEGDKLTTWVGGTSQTYYLATGNVWTNGTAAPAATSGQGMWINRKAGGSTTNIYALGLVPTVENINVEVELGHNFIANPYPSALDVDGEDSDINWSTVASSGKTAINGDLLRIWTGTKYDTFYFFNNGSVSGWYSSDNKGRRPRPILAGEGFWFQRKDTQISTDIAVPRPF